jgi:hypothetical protein
VSLSPKSPRARRSRGSGSASAAGDRQAILVRRAVAAGVGILVLILLIVGIRGCLNSRKDRAYRDYASDVRALVDESDGLSDKLFQVLTQPKGADSLDIQNEINALATDAETHVQRAKSADHPDELNAANGWIVTSLEFRRDGLKQIAQKISGALADRGRRPAIESIAAQMQAFLASDVIYSQRALPEFQQEFSDRGLDERFPRSQFLPNLGWLDPDSVESRLSKIGQQSTAATPGLHGTGLQSVSVKPPGTALSESGVNRVPVSDSLTFDVEVQNQGESEETDVGVSISIRDGNQIDIDQTISRIAPGDAQTVSVPVPRAPSTGAVSNVTVEVQPVPGEKVKDNNKTTYQVVFTKA